MELLYVDGLLYLSWRRSIKLTVQWNQLQLGHLRLEWG